MNYTKEEATKEDEKNKRKMLIQKFDNVLTLDTDTQSRLKAIALMLKELNDEDFKKFVVLLHPNGNEPLICILARRGNKQIILDLVTRMKELLSNENFVFLVNCQNKNNNTFLEIATKNYNHILKKLIKIIGEGDFENIIKTQNKTGLTLFHTILSSRSYETILEVISILSVDTIYNISQNTKIELHPYLEINGFLNPDLIAEIQNRIDLSCMISALSNLDSDKTKDTDLNHQRQSITALYNNNPDIFYKAAEILLQNLATLPELIEDKEGNIHEAKQKKRSSSTFFESFKNLIFSEDNSTWLTSFLNQLFLIEPSIIKEYQTICANIADNLFGIPAQEFGSLQLKYLYTLGFIYLSNAKRPELEVQCLSGLLELPGIASSSLQDLLEKQKTKPSFSSAISLITNFLRNLIKLTRSVHEVNFYLIENLCKLTHFHEDKNAINLLQKLKDKYPSNPASYYYLAKIYFRIGQGLAQYKSQILNELKHTFLYNHKKSIDFLLELALIDIDARITLSQYYINYYPRGEITTAKVRQAITWLEEITSTNSQNSIAYSMLGKHYYAGLRSIVNIDTDKGLQLLKKAVALGNKDALDYLIFVALRSSSFKECCLVAAIIYDEIIEPQFKEQDNPITTSLSENKFELSKNTVIQFLFRCKNWIEDSTSTSLAAKLLNEDLRGTLLTSSQLQKISIFILNTHSELLTNIAQKNPVVAGVWLQNYSKLKTLYKATATEIETILKQSSIQTIDLENLISIINDYSNYLSTDIYENILFARNDVAIHAISDTKLRKLISDPSLEKLVLKSTVHTLLKGEVLAEIIIDYPNLILPLKDHLGPCIKFLFLPAQRKLLDTNILKILFTHFPLIKTLDVDVMTDIISENINDFCYILKQRFDIAEKFLKQKDLRSKLTKEYLTYFITDATVRKNISLDTIAEIVLDDPTFFINSLDTYIAVHILSFSKYHRQLNDELLLSLFLDPNIYNNLPDDAIGTILIKYQDNEFLYDFGEKTFSEKVIKLSLRDVKFAIGFLTSPYLAMIKNIDPRTLCEILLSHADNSDFLVTISKNFYTPLLKPYQTIINFAIKHAPALEAKKLIQNVDISNAIKLDLFTSHKNSLNQILIKHINALNADIATCSTKSLSWLSIDNQATVTKRDLLGTHQKTLANITSLRDLKNLILNMLNDPKIIKPTHNFKFSSEIEKDLKEALCIIENPKLDVKDNHIVITYGK